ncbi:hypothetical protein YV85_001033 [Salmonella enterica subsp. enterica]|uniref:hypothetical protein n=1 Tax=Citrobacter cronae TaxID=1748967 RepID=UPI001868C48C|nr:hypothetical protein [Citrobacter cronae]EDV2725980.1 hypothetical protein [Salmonella enterica subsp. enterica serovar Poona]
MEKTLNHSELNSTEQLSALLGVPVEKFHDELKRLKEQSDEMDRFTNLMAQASRQLKEGESVDLESFFFNGTISSIAALMFAAEFVRGRGKNFYTFDYDLPEFGRINVTIQKTDHKTPAQRIVELEDENQILKGESIALLTSAANELNTSWLNCKACLCMQAAQLCITQGDIHQARNWLSYITDDAGADMPEDMTVPGLEKWFNSNMVANNGTGGFLTHSQAVETLRKSFPATSKAMDEVSQ